MNIFKNKQIRFGSILQYSQLFLSIIISLIYTPIMLRVLGDSEFGIYNLSSSIVSYLSLLSLGFGSAYIRFYTKAKHKGENAVSELNGLYFLTFCFIGLVTIGAGTVIFFNANIFFNNTYSSNDISIAKILIIILTINMAISFPMSLFSSYVISQEKFIFQKLLNIGKTILSPALSIIALFLGYGSIGLVVITLVVNTFVDIFNIVFCLKKLKMKFSFKGIKIKQLRPIFVFSFFIAINQIIDQINWQTDKIVLAKMLNSSAVSIYAIGSTLNTYYMMFSTSISSFFAPQVNEIVEKNESDANEKLTSLMISVGKFQLAILGLLLTGFIFFGKFFVGVWAGPDYGLSYYVALLLMAPATIPFIQNIGIEIQRAKNLHKFRSIVYLIMALLNVGCSIVLCYFFGIIGITLGTTISLIVANGIIINIYYHKKVGLNMVTFWLEMLKIMPAFILPIAVGLLSTLYPINDIWSFLRLIIAYTACYIASMYIFIFKKSYGHKNKK